MKLIFIPVMMIIMKKMVYPDFKKKVVMVTTGDDRNANIIMTPTSIQTEC